MRLRVLGWLLVVLGVLLMVPFQIWLYTAEAPISEREVILLSLSVLCVGWGIALLLPIRWRRRGILFMSVTTGIVALETWLLVRTVIRW